MNLYRSTTLEHTSSIGVQSVAFSASVSLSYCSKYRTSTVVLVGAAPVPVHDQAVSFRLSFRAVQMWNRVGNPTSFREKVSGDGKLEYILEIDASMVVMRRL